MIRILHIEDIPHITALVKQKCKAFNVEAAETLEDARKILAERPADFDLLLIDLNLPDSAGMDTLCGLSEFGLPMVVLTGDPTDDFACRAATLGATDYISKGEIARSDLPVRIRFAYEKSRRESAAMAQKHRSLSFTDFAALKPYLSCAALL